MQYEIRVVKYRKTTLLRLTKASLLVRKFRQLTAELSVVLMLVNILINYPKNKLQQSDSLAIASTKAVLNLYTLQLITEKHCQNLYQQYFATVEQTP